MSNGHKVSLKVVGVCSPSSTVYADMIRPYVDLPFIADSGTLGADWRHLEKLFDETNQALYVSGCDFHGVWREAGLVDQMFAHDFQSARSMDRYEAILLAGSLLSNLIPTANHHGGYFTPWVDKGVQGRRGYRQAFFQITVEAENFCGGWSPIHRAYLRVAENDMQRKPAFKVLYGKVEEVLTSATEAIYPIVKAGSMGGESVSADWVNLMMRRSLCFSPQEAAAIARLRLNRDEANGNTPNIVEGTRWLE